MNRLTGSSFLAKDQLFATMDANEVRRSIRKLGPRFC